MLHYVFTAPLTDLNTPILNRELALESYYYCDICMTSALKKNANSNPNPHFTLNPMLTLISP